MMVYVQSASPSRDGPVPAVVEVHVGAASLPGFAVVGRDGTDQRALRDRVRAAVISSGFRWPTTRVTVTLPRRKLSGDDPWYDLAVAVGVLLATEQIPETSVDEYRFCAGLGLDGSLRAVGGEVRVADMDEDRRVVVAEAAHGDMPDGGRAQTCSAPDLSDVAACLRGEAAFRALPSDPLSRVMRPLMPFARTYMGIDPANRPDVLKALRQPYVTSDERQVTCLAERTPEAIAEWGRVEAPDIVRDAARRTAWRFPELCYSNAAAEWPVDWDFSTPEESAAPGMHTIRGVARPPSGARLLPRADPDGVAVYAQTTFTDEYDFDGVFVDDATFVFRIDVTDGNRSETVGYTIATLPDGPTGGFAPGDDGSESASGLVVEAVLRRWAQRGVTWGGSEVDAGSEAAPWGHSQWSVGFGDFRDGVTLTALIVGHANMDAPLPGRPSERVGSLRAGHHLDLTSEQRRGAGEWILADADATIGPLSAALPSEMGL